MAADFVHAAVFWHRLRQQMCVGTKHCLSGKLHLRSLMRMPCLQGTVEPLTFRQHLPPLGFPILSERWHQSCTLGLSSHPSLRGRLRCWWPPPSARPSALAQPFYVDPHCSGLAEDLLKKHCSPSEKNLGKKKPCVLKPRSCRKATQVTQRCFCTCTCGQMK